MTAEDMEAVLELVNGNWPSQASHGQRQAERKAWWRYCGEFTTAEVMAQVDAVAHDRFAPRPGEIRRRVLAEKRGDTVLTAAQAWGQYLEVTQANAAGLPHGEVNALVVETIRRLGSAGKGLSTNADREFFMKEYRTARAEWEADQSVI